MCGVENVVQKQLGGNNSFQHIFTTFHRLSNDIIN